jgi:MFS family permease
VAGRLDVRIGFKRTLVAACMIGAAEFAVIAAGLDHARIIISGAGIIGVGVGLSFSAVVNIVVSAVRPPGQDGGRSGAAEDGSLPGQLGVER